MSERIDNTFAGDAPASHAGAHASAALPRVALLYADEALLAHIEQALTATVAVVYRATIAQAESAALAMANPDVALVNLDDRCGDKLDVLTAMLDSAGVPIVFNDADISHGLEGWARSRWARHLCAKLCGKDDVDPPRPVQKSLQPVARAAFEPSVELAVDAPMPVTPEATAEPSAPASVPLSQGEIDALLADFPCDAGITGADTAALSAHVDALLADAAGDASSTTAPWEMVAPFADEHAVPAAASTNGSVAAASVVHVDAAPASAQGWALVEDFIPVVSAPREAKAVAPTPDFGSGLAFELEPLEPIIAPTLVRDNPNSEMRLDGKSTKEGSGK